MKDFFLNKIFLKKNFKIFLLLFFINFITKNYKLIYDEKKIRDKNKIF